jgi:protein O-GlcNAc transferase
MTAPAQPWDAALAHHQAGRLPDAEAAYRRVLALDPRNVAANYNLALVLRGLGRREEALACLARVAELQPDNAQAQYGYAHVLREEDRLEEAAAAFRRALALQPDFAEARWSLAMCALPRVYGPGEDPAAARSAFSRELDGLERWFAERPALDAARAVGVAQPFNLAYQEEDNRPLLERYGALCSRLVASVAQNAQSTPRRSTAAGGPLRIGVVSAHFRNHSVWNAITRGWFEHLDRKRFSLQAFHLGSLRDGQTDLARARADHFEEGRGGLREWAEAIGRQAPDVLIYPELGMETLAWQLAALRLAPVQVTTWGHPETSGLPTMDYFLSAEGMEPEGAAAHYSEKLVALPHLGCHVQKQALEVQAPDLARWGIPADEPLLLCPGVPFKYAPAHDAVLAEIAQRLGRCRLLFFAYGAGGPVERLKSRLRAAFDARGVDFASHFGFLPWQPPAAFHGWLSRADVFLDTIGFSGFNTALQGIQRALPVVAREGRFLRGRMASGILRRMGLDELVAPTTESYVDLAVRLIEERKFSETIRQRMRAGRERLYGDLAPIRALEDFLERR